MSALGVEREGVGQVGLEGKGVPVSRGYIIRGSHSEIFMRSCRPLTMNFMYGPPHQVMHSNDFNVFFFVAEKCGDYDE